jgi:L-iditol 2-dehydrogenase
LIRVRSTGICGSDLHSYLDGRIGDTTIQSPVIPGHEFAGVVVETGPECLDGNHRTLTPGTRVAVDPASPCGHCELCDRGHPNLCRRLHFCGLWPDAGSLSDYILMPSKTCFPIPEDFSFEEGALLEPLGIALHAVDLAKPRVAESGVILGAGPIGLLILQVARQAGLSPLMVTDRHPWRLELAKRMGADHVLPSESSGISDEIIRLTGGFGADVVWEAAWGEETVTQSAEIASLGGRIILVGIPRRDVLEMKASTARRKGLTIKLSRRMKHTYPRTIQLARTQRIELETLITHRFPLAQAPEAFVLNAEYRDQAVKVMISS